MPTNTFKILGQSAPSATTDTTLYTVPSATQVVISSIVVCNRGSANATFRIALRPNGATLANSHYIAFDETVVANQSTFLKFGGSIDASDVITVRASTADVTFSAFGCEVT